MKMVRTVGRTAVRLDDAELFDSSPFTFHQQDQLLGASIDEERLPLLPLLLSRNRPDEISWGRWSMPWSKSTNVTSELSGGHPQEVSRGSVGQRIIPLFFQKKRSIGFHWWIKIVEAAAVGGRRKRRRRVERDDWFKKRERKGEMNIIIKMSLFSIHTRRGVEVQ